MDEINLKNINKKIAAAAKWSGITELMAKLVTPITSMILARIITKEAFGIVAVVSMVISFAEIFADAGFQKYIIQREFKDNNEMSNNANVAFWTNFVISFILVIAIFILRNPIASLVGSPGSGLPIAVGSLSLLLIAFSSIQGALFKRDLNFKKIFIVRIFTIIVPFAITFPLAFLGLSYWSIIIGTLSTNLLNAILLTVFSKWKPRFFYSFKLFKQMFSFSFLTMLDTFLIWINAWLDIFIIGRYFTEYHLGLYRTSINMVNTFIVLITAAILPIMLSALSRLQNNEKQFNNTYLKMQTLLSLILIPAGVGIYLFQNLATIILLGHKWMDASYIIGIWALVSVIRTVYISVSAPAFRAKGKALIPALTQIIHLAFLIPLCIIFAKQGFESLVYARSLIKLQGVILVLILLKFILNFPVNKIVKNNIPILLSTAFMAGAAYGLLQISKAVWWQFVAIFICIVVYVLALCIFPSTRKILLDFAKKGYNKAMQLLKKPKRLQTENLSIEIEKVDLPIDINVENAEDEE